MLQKSEKLLPKRSGVGSGVGDTTTTTTTTSHHMTQRKLGSDVGTKPQRLKQ